MDWLDYHLHEFRLLDAAERCVVSIGIPIDDDPEDRPVVPGWEVSLAKFFDRRGWHFPPAMYAYDFGDDWQHVLVHEGFEPADDGRGYPRCVAGECRCPPEDCGGVHGYAEFLQIIADPDGVALDPSSLDGCRVSCSGDQPVANSVPNTQPKKLK